MQLLRDSTQQREVQPQPVTVGGVSRHDHRHSGCLSLPYATSHRQVHRHCEKFPIASGTPRPALAGVVGTHVIAGEAGPPRKTQNALTPMASEVTLVPGERPSQPPGTPVPAGRGGPLLVDGEGPPTRGDTLRNSDPRPPSILGCVPSGLGSSPPRPVSVGSMVTAGELITHQSPGIEGPVPSPPFVQTSCHRPPGDSDVRQFDGSRLCQQAGGNSLRLPLLVDRATSSMDGSQQGPTGSEVPAGTIQRPGRPTQPPQPSPGCGMVASPAGSEGPTAHVGFRHARPVRNTSRCQAAPVLLPDPGSPDPLRGRLPASLGQSRHVRVPSLPSGRESSGSGQRDPKSLDDSSRPYLAGEGVVRGTTPPSDPTTSGTTTVGSTATPTHFHRFHRGVHALNLQVSPQKVGLFERSCARDVQLCQGIHCTFIPVAMARFLWLVS